ncbi:MAG: FHA domain-containing protein [Myxococcota bacterium]
MSDRHLSPTPPQASTEPMPSPTTSTRFSICCEGHEVTLPAGVLVMGRGSRCHIVVDDLLASREHARLTVTEDSVVVEDLGSTNGVYVNEHRIHAPTPVMPGDRIVVGTQELELRDRAAAPARDAQPADFKDLAMLSTGNPLLSMDEPGVEPAPAQVTTEKADVVTTLGRLADRMLTMGRFDAAERVLQGQLHEVLAGARTGHTVRPDVFEAVVDYGLRLAEVTRKAAWLNYVVEIHMIAGRVMEGPVITRVATLLPSMGGDVDREMFFFYQEAMRQKREDLSLADRVACDRLLKLELSP